MAGRNAPMPGGFTDGFADAGLEDSRCGRIHLFHAPVFRPWGRDHVLEDGQRMIRYLIFSKEPLDVVYNPDGTIDAIYTSYE